MALAERELHSPAAEPFLTESEYLAQEETAAEKSEYVHGRKRPMSGGTLFHGALAMLLGSALIIALRGRGCLVASSDVKVSVGGILYYPDVSIVCETPQYYGSNATVITNPILIAEVLSPSTENIDRGEKFHKYLTLASLQSYLLVSQSEPQIELFSRRADGHWDYVNVFGLDSALNIPALSIVLNLANVYEGIDFAGEAENE